MNRQEIIAIIEELTNASTMYYGGEQDSFLTDEEFDSKQSLLLRYSDKEEFADLFEPGSQGYALLENDIQLGGDIKISEDEAVNHDVPMLSLNKAKKSEQLESFIIKMLNNGATGFNLQAKLDGSAISVKYVNGKVQNIATRGTGIVGLNVSYLLQEPQLKIQGMFPFIKTSHNIVELRGEMFFTMEQFEKATKAREAYSGEAFENSRNALAGIVKRAKKGLGYPVEATFCVYSIVSDDTFDKDAFFKDNPKILDIQSLTQKESGSLHISNIKTFDEVMESVKAFGELRKSFHIPTDGIVVKPVNETEMNTKMGYTHHHPSSQIAWKYPSENAETIIEEIFITVKKTGKITPIARFTPVRLDNSTVMYASLHNFNHMNEKNIKIGSHILVEKSNDIIPQVVAVVSNNGATDFNIPQNCPMCSTTLEAGDQNIPPKTLFCPNDDCDSRLVNTLIYAVSRKALDIDGLSESTITSLFEKGSVRYIEDIYTLSVEDLSNAILDDPTRVSKNAVKIFDTIQSRKNLPLARVLTSLGIKNLGERMGKTLAKEYGTLDNLYNASVSDLTSVDGIAEKTAMLIAEGLQKNRKHLDALVSLGVLETVEEKTDTENNTDSSLAGLSFSISGSVPSMFANRQELVDYLESRGAVFDSSPKKTTSYMIGDSSDSSSKIKKAVSLGLSFLSPDDFMARFTR